MARDIEEHFPDTLQEKQHYFIANFQVLDNMGQYKATDHSYKLLFSASTHVHRVVLEDIPLNPYSFMPIAEILKSDVNTYAEQLIG